MTISRGSRCRTLVFMVLWCVSGRFATAVAEPVTVRYPEGIMHGFLHLRTIDGARLGDGELIQTHRNRTLTSRLVFRFRDGSRFEETTVFTQSGTFRLISDHVIQRGPAFPQALDVSIDAVSGQVTVRYTEDGEKKVASEHLDLPADLANGLVQTLLKNVRPESPPASFSYVAATPKPRLVKLSIAVAGTDRFAVGRLRQLATHYVLKVDVGAIKGAVASLLGKTPPDSHVWVLGGEAPLFLRAEQPFFSDGPLWRVELVSPDWSPVTPTTARPTASHAR